MNFKQIQKKIHSIFENDADVAAVYLFGSLASHKAHPNSDIDLAILFRHPSSKLESYQKLEKYFALLARVLRSEPDLVDLAHINLILLYEILKDGKLLIENDVEQNRNFMARKIIECLDFQVTMKRCAEGMYRKAKERMSG